MLTIDGVKYKLWTPKNEENEFHPMIIKHSKEIFGENSLYLPIEKRLVSKAGRGVMPDGFAIVFSVPPKMYVVEVELSSHDLDKHIVEQLNRFGRALRNPENRKRIADRLHREIKGDLMKEAFVRQMIGPKEIYKFLFDLISQPPNTVIIIEHKDEMVIEACESLKLRPEILEFKTFVREGAESARAHLFEPLYIAPRRKLEPKVEKRLAKRHVLRKEFWTQLLKKAKEKTDLHSNISPNIYNWIGTSAGKSGIGYNYVITYKYGGCEIYLDRGKKFEDPNINKIRFDKLYEHKDQIEEEFGEKLNWERLDNKRASRISFEFEGIGLRDKDRWDNLQNKMIDAMIRLEKAFGKYIKQLD